MVTKKVVIDSARSLANATESDRRNVGKISNASASQIVATANADGSAEFAITADSSESVDLAEQLLKYATQLGKSPVNVPAQSHANTMVLHAVPSLYLPIILGRNAAFLSALEQELSVVVFMADDKEVTVSDARKVSSVINPPGMTLMLATDGDILIKKPNLGITGIAPLAVFSHNIKCLVAFKLKLMALVETKMKGLYTVFSGHNGVDLNTSPQMHYNVPGLCVDTYPILEDELSLALGKQGANRRRVSLVSNCAVDYIGNCAFFYGDLIERQVARNLLTIILERGKGSFQVNKWRGMIGVATVDFPMEQIGCLTGKQGSGIHQVEETAKVVCFVDGKTASSSQFKPSGTEGKRVRTTLLPPVPKAGHADVRNPQEGKAILVILGKDEYAQQAIGLIQDRLRTALAVSADSQHAPEDSQTAANFLKLFRAPGRSNRISMTEATVPNGTNKVHSAVCESIRNILKCPNTAVSPIPDLTVVEVPNSFFSNNLQSLLKQIEDEYGVMCGYVQYGDASESSFVVVVGGTRPRRAAELKLMTTVETKQRGFYTHRIVRDDQTATERPWFVSTEDFDTDSYPISEQNLSFALGNKGSIRKKLAIASGCILEYVGEVAYLSGSLAERTRGRDYLKWVLQQLEGEVTVGDYAKRTDVSALLLTKRAAGFVNGNKGKALRTIEELTGTFCFIGKSTKADTRLLFVCGSEAARASAMHSLEKYVNQYKANDWMDDANEASGSAEMSKSHLEQVLRSNGLYLKPLEPWKTGISDVYPWVCQPLPGAARPDAVLASEKSSVLMRTTSKKSPKNVNSNEFVNDVFSFPELGSRPASQPLGSSPSSPRSPRSPPSPPSPPPPVVVVTETGADAGIFIDRVKGEVWGDWGLGPNGDPDVYKSAGNASQNWPGLTPSPQPKLMGAWK